MIFLRLTENKDAQIWESSSNKYNAYEKVFIILFKKAILFKCYG